MPRENEPRLTIAVLGLGEAGGAIARDLVAAGAVVRGYDPAVPAPDGIVDTAGEDDAVTGADLVLSVNSAHDTLDAVAVEGDRRVDVGGRIDDVAQRRVAHAGGAPVVGVAAIVAHDRLGSSRGGAPADPSCDRTS